MAMMLAAVPRASAMALKDESISRSAAMSSHQSPPFLGLSMRDKAGTKSRYTKPSDDDRGSSAGTGMIQSAFE